MEDIEQDEPIFDLATRCEELFATQISLLNDHNEPNGAKSLWELNHRFAAWAAFLGVFAESNVCLDRRLQHHAEIQDQVLRLLDILEKNLTYVFEQDDDSSDRMEVESDALQKPSSLLVSISSLEAITGAIGRLNQLGIAIRQSSVTSQITKAREFAETFDLGSFREVAYLSLKTLYSSTSDGLLQQLTQSMTETYALFLHRKSRQERLQVPRPRARTPSPLPAITEEPSTDTNVESPMDIDNDMPPPSRDQIPRILGPPPVRPARNLPPAGPTSVDSQEYRVRLRKMLSSSIKSKTMSILANHADYPQPAKGTLTCEWCFCPIAASSLEKANWRQHVNEDHEPYVCISEKCSESLPRFATSTQWFRHMLTIHGQNWHREVHAPSSWPCPLCTDEGATFSRPEDLTEHFADVHEGIFKETQVQVIVRQSRTRSPRAHDTCPLCCFPVSQQDPSSKEATNKNEEPSPKKPHTEANLECRNKRIKTETGHVRSDHKSADDRGSSVDQLEKRAPVDSSSSNPIGIEVISSHVAAHLQGIMLLTLRLITIDVAMDVSADNQSTSGGTDHNSSWISSSKSDLDQKMENIEDFPLPRDDETDPDYEHLSKDMVPDSENIDWHDVPRQYNAASEDGPPEKVEETGPHKTRLLRYDSPLPHPFNGETEMEHRLRTRAYVIRKLIDSEISFGRDMMVLNDIYKSTSNSCPDLSADDLKVLFRNSDQVLQFSLGFKDDLAKTASVLSSHPNSAPSFGKRSAHNSHLLEKDWSTGVLRSPELEEGCSILIGQTFRKHLPQMEKIYTDYSRHHEAAITRLQTLQEYPKVITWLEECDSWSSDLTETTDLQALLIEPVQRIPIYRLLLGELLGSTPHGHADWTSTTGALEDVINVGLRIDEMKKRQDLVSQAIGRKPKRFDVSSALSRAFNLRKVTINEELAAEETLKYREYSLKFGDNFFQIQLIMRDIEEYLSSVKDAMDYLGVILSSVEIFMRISPSNYPELESKWARARLSFRDFQSKHLHDHINMVQMSVISPIVTLMQIYGRPQTLMHERNLYLTDYMRFKSTKEQNGKPDKKTTKQAEKFIALNETLEDELPKLFNLTAKLMEACLNNFVQIQTIWFRTLEETFRQYVDWVPNDLETIISDWSGEFSYQEAQLLSLGICNGSALVASPNFANVNTLSTGVNSSSPSALNYNMSRTSSSDSPLRLSRLQSFRTQAGDNSNSADITAADNAQAPGRNVRSNLVDFYGSPMQERQKDDQLRQPSNKPPSLPKLQLFGDGPSRGYARKSIDLHADSNASPPRLPDLSHLTSTSIRLPDFSTGTNEDSLKTPTSRYSGLFSSALPMSDRLDEASRNQDETQQRQPPQRPEVIFLAASLFEFNKPNKTKIEAGYAYLSYVSGEIFDVYAERGELWLASNQDDPDRTVGWLWSKHFAKLSS
ncbi:hypothetical protein AJ79_01050 [Helicocarpus griseus UAMH5409]|uniref:DH domain-containing protein n=1 Tax=Helicocarpus griseus UAMH5409 TaxID=1447875 RepID=A0A2B7Y9U2_9EURO|nr:hypothetical protein AJ79_01050 [Helicocarpus griseus UAMH5409]